ncbi:hypothetical protein DRN34_02225 [Thermococci archaeon]|nr:MAG: hypothetical protein DRN34_02225 [Thermococci archaeon]
MIIGINNRVMLVVIDEHDFPSQKRFNAFKKHMMDAAYSKSYFLLHHYCIGFDDEPSIRGINIHKDIRQLRIELSGWGRAHNFVIENPAYLAKHGAHITKRVVNNLNHKTKGRCKSIW